MGTTQCTSPLMELKMPMVNLVWTSISCPGNYSLAVKPYMTAKISFILRVQSHLVSKGENFPLWLSNSCG